MKTKIFIFIILVGACIYGLLFYFDNPNNSQTSIPNPETQSAQIYNEPTRPNEQNKPEEYITSSTTPLPDMETPKEIKALYVTAQTVSYPPKIEKIISLAKNSEINAVVVNVKDGDGTYLTKGMRRLVERLYKESIYPIARVVTFQDSALAKKRPDFALKTTSGEVFEGDSYNWVDPSNKEVWDGNVDAAVGALEMGFKEINFDYFRFPSEGSTTIPEIIYPFYDGKTLKEDVITNAASYITSAIKEKKPDAIISLDIFAYTFIAPDSLGIGQKLTKLEKYFDIICPMVYPSHYSTGNFGFKNPANHPYEVITQTITLGKQQLQTSNPNKKIRPWIQHFNMGAIYDAEMIRKQIQAITDAGLTDGYMVWSPSNNYIDKAFNLE